MLDYDLNLRIQDTRTFDFSKMTPRVEVFTKSDDGSVGVWLLFIFVYGIEL